MDEQADVTLADRFRGHFGHTDHLYGALLAEMADDWDVGGVTWELFEGWQDAPPQQMPHLRLLAGLFRIVLRGDAPHLEGFYPALGGDLDPHEAWAAVRPVLAAHVDELRGSLTRGTADQRARPHGRVAHRPVGGGAPVRPAARAAARARGIGRPGPARRPVPLRSGTAGRPGLRTRRSSSTGCGAAGFEPASFEVVERRGCDVAPVDAASPAGGIYLTSFVWPWQLDRHARLAAALRVARDHPVVVDRAPASLWVAERLADPVADDVLTVVWHSVTRMYWPAEESAAVAAAVDGARTSDAGRARRAGARLGTRRRSRAPPACRCSSSTGRCWASGTTTDRPYACPDDRAATP